MSSIRLAWITAFLALSGCTAAQMQTASTTGAVFCAKATADGPLVVSLVSATASPAAIVATGATADFVAAACRAWAVAAVPVAPPAVAVPSVAVVVPAG